MTKTKNGRFNRMIAILLMLIMVCSLLPTTVFADNTSQNVPDIGSDFYSDTVTTRLDDTVAVTADTYYQNAISTEVANPTLPTIVKQSQSTTTLYDFAAGLPLSAIFIDETKLGKKLGTFALEPNENQDYTGLITRDPATNTVSYNPGQTVDRHLLNGAPTVLEGPLFSFTFDDAAILPNGTLANLKITYSNAQLFTDERLAVMEKVAQEALDAAQKELEDALTPAQKAAARAKIAAAQANLTASYHRGMVSLAQGSTLEYSHNDARNLTVANTSTGFSQAQVDAAKTAYENRIKKYQEQTDLGDIADGGINYPSLGKSLDVTYTVVDDEGHPINGDFIFAFVGINLERDPYAITANNGGRGLWWVNDEYPDMHFFNEQVAVTNNSIASDYIYVRPNNTMVEPINPNLNPPNESKRTGYFPQVVEATENGVQKTKFIANRGQSLDSNDGYYSSGFVTLATSGFTITAYGHSYGNGGNMNTQAYGSRRIWYRYISTTGPNGNIQTTSEGNFGGGLNDASDAGKSANILDPGTYVVPEGKTVTYTMTPNPEYHISKLQVRNEDGDMQEVRFNGKPLYTMEEGDTVQFRDAAGQLCTLTALADGKFKLEMPYALHDEEVHVQWERTIATVTVKKVTEDNKSGSFPFEIMAWKIEKVPIYTPVPAGSIWYQDGDFWLEYGNGEATPDTDGLAAIVSVTRLTDRIEISGGKYLWKTDKKLSDLGLSASGEDDDLFVDFLNAPSAVIGDTLDNTLNTEHERISFYRLNSTTEEVTTYWNFAEGEGQTTDPVLYEFSLANGEEKTFDIPQKYEYEVYEETPAGWVLVSIDGTEDASSATGLLSEENYATKHTFLNRQLPCGDLIVTKTLAGNAPIADAEFSFTVTLSDTSITDPYGEMSFENGVATFTLTGGQSKTATGLPAGTGYTVTEADYSSEGYVTTSTGDTGTIDEQTPAVAEFTNTRDTFGDLTVMKTVVGNAPTADKEFSFTVTLSDTSITGPYGEMSFENGVAKFELKHGESITAANLPNGISYTVEETDYTSEGYVTTKTGETGTIVGNDEVTAAFTNTRNADGSLTVSKTLEGNDTDSTKEFSFTITLSDKAISGEYSGVAFTNGVATVTLKGGESKTIEGLPNGTGYKVTEAAYTSDGYETTSVGDTDTIDENAPKVAAFTNTRNTYGNLVVTKTVDGNAPIAGKEFSFTVTLSDKTITGEYGEMTFKNGVATFTLKNGESKTATGLPNGITYVVTEADYTADGYVTTSTGETGSITGGEAATVEFTNTRNTYGDLIVKKTVKGNAASTTKEFTFAVTLSDKTISGDYGEMTFENGATTFKLKDGESKTATGLPNGVGYTVVESDNSGYQVTKIGDTGTIIGGSAQTAAFTNTRNTTPPPDDPSDDPKTGNLTVSKTVTGEGADPNKAFTFTVTLSSKITGKYGDMNFTKGVATFTLKGGESKKATGLPEGITYEVTETDYSADGYVTTKTGDTGKIVANGTATADFTNTKTTTPPPPDNPPDNPPDTPPVTPPDTPEYGSLTVKKTVTGDLANKDQYFTFTITFNASGSYSYTGSKSGTIKSGEAVQLKHGESITISGLPAGTTYAVTESGHSGYRAYASGNTGTIAANKTSTAAFTNARISVPQTGDDSNLLLWLSMAGAAGIGMVLTAIFGKKRKGKHIAAR